MKIAILGAGAFGTALGGILAEKGYDIDYYDSKVEKERLSDVLSGTKMMLLAIPSKSIPYLLPYLPKNKPLIVATKGILSGRTFADFEDYMVLSGPGFADDIKAHKNTILTATDVRVIEMFSCGYMSFDYTDDENGVLMCGALKNVYAILAGKLDLKRGSEEWENFVWNAAGEMKLILEANNARSETVDLSCGIGDLRLTCDYPSRNYEFGQKIRLNPDYQPEKTVEGVTALKKIKNNELVVPEAAKIIRGLMAESKKWA